MAKPKQPMKGVFQKNGYWYARVDGKQVYCGKGDKGHVLAVAARAKDITKAYENKEVNAGLMVKRIHFKTVEELSNWYMELPSVQQQKIYKRKISLSVHLLNYFGKMRLNQIEIDTQEQYREHRRLQGAADGTIDFEIALLSTMYHTALESKKITFDVMPGRFVMVRKRNPRPILTKKQYEKLIKRSDPDFADILICGYESAMRLSEICNLTVNQVHLDLQHISGRKLNYIDLGLFDTKTGARRTVPVSPELKAVFIRRMEGLELDDPVFTQENGKKWYYSRIEAKFKTLCEKAKVPYGDKNLNAKGERIGIVFHCLRHTRTTLWVKMGFSDEIVRRATGHRTLEAYQQYIKLDPEAVMMLVRKRDKSVPKTAQTIENQG
jgi:integrase